MRFSLQHLKAIERKLGNLRPSPLAGLTDDELTTALAAVTSGQPIPQDIEKKMDEALLRLPRDPVLARLSNKQLLLALEAERTR